MSRRIYECSVYEDGDEDKYYDPVITKRADIAHRARGILRTIEAYKFESGTTARLNSLRRQLISLRLQYVSL